MVSYMVLLLPSYIVETREILFLYCCFWCRCPGNKTSLNFFSKFLRSTDCRCSWVRKGPIQCHNWQGYFHSAKVCHLKLRSVKCAGVQKIADYPKPYEDPSICTHCDGTHTHRQLQTQLCHSFRVIKPKKVNKKAGKILV